MLTKYLAGVNQQIGQQNCKKIRYLFMKGTGAHLYFEKKNT